MAERGPALSNRDHDEMDKFLDWLFQAVAAGEIKRKNAVSCLGQVIGAIDSGNVGEAQEWFKDKRADRFERD